MKILGVDPGKRTGWAFLYCEKGEHLKLGIFGVTEDLTLLEIQPQVAEADLVVYEDYKVRPKMARKGDFDWDPMWGPRAIGSLLTLCALLQKETVIQQPVERIPGFGFAGMKYVPGKKGRHWQDALAHAAKYGVSKLGALPVAGS